MLRLQFKKIKKGQRLPKTEKKGESSQGRSDKTNNIRQKLRTGLVGNRPSTWRAIRGAFRCVTG